MQLNDVDSYLWVFFYVLVASFFIVPDKYLIVVLSLIFTFISYFIFQNLHVVLTNENFNNEIYYECGGILLVFIFIYLKIIKKI